MRSVYSVTSALFILTSCSGSSGGGSSSGGEAVESAVLTVSDPEQPEDLALVYRSPNAAGWKDLCVPFKVSWASDGWTSTPTFTYNGAVYEAWAQWEEGEIALDGYSGPAPHFFFEKRHPDATDTGGNSGSGVYSCDGVSSCSDQCNLTVTNYSKSDMTATLEITCSNLKAYDTTDQDNLFGEYLSDFRLTINCDY